MKTPLTLTPRNAAALSQYATLVGMTPEAFLNRFLSEFLVNRFGDRESGNAEGFLASFTFKDYTTAMLVADWIKERLTFPNSRDTLEVEVFEIEGGYRIKAAWIGDGQMLQIC